MTFLRVLRFCLGLIKLGSLGLLQSLIDLLARIRLIDGLLLGVVGALWRDLLRTERVTILNARLPLYLIVVLC